MLPNGPSSEAVQNYDDELERFFVESSCQLAKLLSQAGRTEEADKALCTAIKHDPVNNELARCRYGLHVESGRPAQVLLVLREHKAALQKAAYSPQEIHDILAALTCTTA